MNFYGICRKSLNEFNWRCFILSHVVICFAQQPCPRKTSYPSSWAGETQIKNLDENEKENSKSHDETKSPYCQQNPQSKPCVIEQKTTLIIIRGFNLANKWVKSLMELNDAIKGPRGHEPGDATQSSEMFG